MTTKADIAQTIQDVSGVGKQEAKEMTELILQYMCESLVQGEDVKISGFGHFQLREKAERMGRNPRTGEPAVITARSVVTFRPSRLWKQAVQASEQA